MTAKQLQKRCDDLIAEVRDITSKQSFRMDSPVQVTGKFAELFATTAQIAEISTRRLVYLTWALVGLTVALLGVTIAQLLKG